MAQNEEFLPENGLWGHSRSCINHDSIKHDSPVGNANGLLGIAKLWCFSVKQVGAMNGGL